MATKKPTTKSTPKKTASASISILGGGNKADMRKWEVESAMSTLKRAAEIQKDAKIMSEVKKAAIKQTKIYSNLANGKIK